ncbi:unnamed protein product [Sphagnum jensenii]|uniref:Uncharacterized protein n=1 Tax=Sphagnum jensenii TaxID=128206 RepID=A0ABP1AF00_9BRYO
MGAGSQSLLLRCSCLQTKAASSSPVVSHLFVKPSGAMTLRGHELRMRTGKKLLLLQFLQEGKSGNVTSWVRQSVKTMKKEKKEKKKLGLIMADVGFLSSSSQGVKSVVEGLKWAFQAVPSWESAAIATCTVFVCGAPVLLAGLSVPGFFSAFLLGLLTWRAIGYQGFCIVSLYFVLGTLATKVKVKQKEAAGIAEKKSGRRGPGSVLGSGAAGVLCASAAIAGVGGLEWEALWHLGFLASFCTKLSDTISSEIGKAYGKTTYLVTTMSIVPRGTEGAVSLEGTLAGLLASVILSAVAYALKMTDQTGAIICVVAAQIANLCESFIGAALQGRKGYEWITNDIANIANIMIGATLAILIRRLTVGM